MAGDGVLTDTTLQPGLAQLVAGLVDGHPSLKVVHTAEHQVYRTPTTEMALAGREGVKPGDPDSGEGGAHSHLILLMKCWKLSTVVML